MSRVLEEIKYKKYKQEGYWATIIGTILFFIGCILYSITSTMLITVDGEIITIGYQPYGDIGHVLILFGVICIVVGIIFYLNYNAKLNNLYKKL